MGNLHLKVVYKLSCLGLYHSVRDISGNLFCHLLHKGILKSPVRFLLALLGDLLFQISLQFLQSVKLRDILGKLIVQCRDFLFLHLMDLYLKHHCLASQLRGVVLGERDIKILLLPSLHPDNLLFKSGDKAMGTQLQAVVGSLAALKGYAVQETLKVDHSGVTLLSFPLHAHKAGIAVQQGLDALIHISGRDLHLVFGRAEALVLAQGYIGVHGNHGLEGEPVLRGLAHQLHGGIAYHLELLFLHSSVIGIGERNINGLFKKHLCAIHALDQLPRSLAGTEARYIDLFAHLLICFFNGGLKFRRAHLNGQRDLTFLNFFAAFHTHFVYSSVHHRLHTDAFLYFIRRIRKMLVFFQGNFI